MTEYDYSPDAWEKYFATQQRIANWVDSSQKYKPCDPSTSLPTPYLEAKALRREERRARRRLEADQSGTDEDQDRRRRTRRSRRRREDSEPLAREYVLIHTRPRAQSQSTVPLPNKSRPPVLPPPPINIYPYRDSGHSSESSSSTPPTSATHYPHVTTYARPSPVPTPSKTPLVPWTEYVMPASTSPKPPSLFRRMLTGLTTRKQSKPSSPQYSPQPTPYQTQYVIKYNPGVVPQYHPIPQPEPISPAKSKSSWKDSSKRMPWTRERTTSL